MKVDERQCGRLLNQKLYSLLVGSEKQAGIRGIGLFILP